MGLRNRRLKKGSYHVLRETNMPAIITRGGFMDSASDISALTKEQFSTALKRYVESQKIK